MTMRKTETTKRRKAPNGEAMSLHNFKCDDPAWELAQERAAERGESVSDMLRRALDKYGQGGRI